MKKHENTTRTDLFFVLNLFEKSGATYWLDGGWGVDALTGTQRRVHRDVDIDFDAAHTAEIVDLLMQNGWTVETDQLPCRMEFYSPAHGYVDIHPFEILSDGRLRQADLNGSWWYFEQDFFTDAIFDGRKIPCVSLKGQTVFHSGYEWRGKDRIDMENLKKFAEPRNGEKE